MTNCLSPPKPVHLSTSHFSSKPSKPRTNFSLDKRLLHLCSKGKLNEAIFIVQNKPISVKPKTYTDLLNSCIDSGSLELGRKLHSCINLSNKKNVILETKLVSMYAKCGSLLDARKVFDEMRKRSLITWTAMIGAYVREESWAKAIHLFYLMMHEGVTPDSFLLRRIVQACANAGDFKTGELLHSIAERKGFFDPKIDTQLADSLLSMYAKWGNLLDARKLFDEMRKRSLITWTAMIGAYVREERWVNAIHLFYLMMHEGVIPDSFLLPRIVQACGNTGDFKTGELLHSIAEKKGFFDPKVDTHIANSLLSMYMKCGQLDLAKKFFSKMAYKNLVSWNSFISGLLQCGEKEEAIRVFDLMRSEGLEPDVFTWNILTTNYSEFENSNSKFAINMIKQMEEQGIIPDVFTYTIFISGFVHNNKCKDALQLFDEMLSSKIEPNGMTIASIISACASLKSLKEGKILHCYAIKRSIANTVLVSNSLIDMYSKCENFEDARKLFDKMHERDLFSWNSIIAGYAQAGYFSKAFDLFTQMEKLGFRRDAVTWNVLISACFKSGDLDQAMDLFNKMERNGTLLNTASWNTLIAGMSRNGYFDEALSIFRKMQRQKFPLRPNFVSILSIRPGLGHLVCSSKVREIHGFVTRINILNDNTRVMNALIDTYAKSDQLDYALSLFRALKSKTLISWNSIIASCVLHGRAGTALDLFHQMKLEGIRPNNTTIFSVINAYGIKGLVREAEELFHTMSEQYGLNPNSNHFAGMINLYGRAGRLKDAFDLLDKMANEPDDLVMSALLKAARMNGDLQFLKLMAEKFELESWSPQTGILQYNTYALKDKDKVDMKYHGCCYVEVKNKVHYFANGEVKNDLVTKVSELTEIGVDNGLELRGVNSLLDYFEEKEKIGMVHSEKQAIAFGIFNSSGYKCIRIIKNGRMCSHCHTFAKSVSNLHKRVIVVKDSDCLHRFDNGECSCRDYW
ncbi:hypothetical protein LUZ60_017569 [Juncus effusus]|nr:hypothetical protein LUZ60_017569 [Juncus effusus]